MSFRVWFRRWIRSIYRLMMASIRPYKSDKQRKKEQERRRKAKYAPYRPFKKKRKYKRRHSGNYKMLSALCDFMATSLGVLLLPLGLFHWGYKSAKRTHRKRTAVGRRKSPRKTSQARAKSTTAQVKQKKAKNDSKPKSIEVTSVAVTTKVEDKPKISTAYTSHVSLFEINDVVTPPPPPQPKEPDENTPKSTPKKENDQYIRKRMIIAGSSYCDAAVLAKLQIGTYIELEAEPDNPYDKDAVKLLFEGEKIGYIAKEDRLAFVTCLKLKRQIYGVITNIVTENNFTKYEYETWFGSVEFI